MKVLFIVPYPMGESPSQRFRFEQYFHVLEENKIEYRVQPFLGRSWKIFYQEGRILSKAWLLLCGFARRTAVLFTLYQYDFVFIHREASPVGPPVFEWLIHKLFGKKIIYDFDDAIWLTDRLAESPIFRWLKCRTKVEHICSWSHRVSVGNEYLLRYASQFNSHCTVIPTTVDTEKVHNPMLYHKPAQRETINIGWTGSASTIKYLEVFSDVLATIVEKFPNVVVSVIADKKPGASLSFAKFIPWNSATEIADLNEFDIGIMPLPDDEWSRGKCGFKAIQYMAMGIPAVVSPVGVNVKIVDSGTDGYIAETKNEWVEALTQLINHSEVRTRLGNAARKKIIENYSVISNRSAFLRLFA